MEQLSNPVNLIVVQKSKIDDWMDHIKEYHESYNVYNLTNKKQLENFINDNSYKVGIINYDSVWRKEELLKLKDFSLILDESSLIQNESAKRTKFIMKLDATNIVLLSGTPVSGHLENLYSQAKLLGWNITKTEFWDRYIRTRDIPGNGFPIKIVIGYKNVDELKDKLREHGAIFMKTEEVLDLPEQTNITIKCDRPKEYTDFAKSFYICYD